MTGLPQNFTSCTPAPFLPLSAFAPLSLAALQAALRKLLAMAAAVSHGATLTHGARRQALAALFSVRSSLPVLRRGSHISAAPRPLPAACPASTFSTSSSHDPQPAALFPGSGLATYEGSSTHESGWTSLRTGLQFKDLQEGWGAQPSHGQQVVVHYTALNSANDRLYECTYQSGKPAKFALNEG